MYRQAKGRAHWALLIVAVLVLVLVAAKHVNRRSDKTGTTKRPPPAGLRAQTVAPVKPHAAATPTIAQKPAPSGPKTAAPPPAAAKPAPAKHPSLPASPAAPAATETARLREPPEPLPGSDFDKCLGSGRPTVADFGAGWCEACKLMDPVLKVAAVRYEGIVNILFVDTDEYGPLAKQHRVSAIPTQIFFDTRGKEVGRHIGYYPIEDLDAQLRSLGLIK